MKAIFVEGSNDVKFWEVAIKKINGNIAEDLLFIPCGGDQVEFFINAELCKKINRKFLFILDSDKGAIDYASKLANKQNLKTKVLSLGGKFEMLHKREIENYYNISAIQRLLTGLFTLPADFEITDFNDMKDEIKTKILTPSGGMNFKAKNNFDIFNEMTRNEWIASAKQVTTEKTDIELIIDKINE